MMKNIIVIFGLLLFVYKSNAQNTSTLVLSFKGMKSDVGALYIGIHNKKDDFLKIHFREAVYFFKGMEATVIFENMPEGEYAVSAFHDENNNNKLDTNFMGIPKEPMGISNDAEGFMGPPKYEDAKFYLKEDRKEIQIQIKKIKVF